ncbi:MAG TPA: hypothetical protein VKY39_00665 [Aggregatilineales bacterium]|nr:hypothetical protein [Aggregatilineales bacterium]
MVRRPRFPWLALIAGLLVGLVGGLVYAWFVDPVSYEDTAPSLLNDADRAEYVTLIAEAYLLDEDLARAQRRLAYLGEEDLAGVAERHADAALLRGVEPYRVRALTALAEALGGAPRAAEVFSSTPIPTAPPTAAVTPTGEPASPVPDQEPTIMPTSAEPSPTPELFPQTDLTLSQREIVCEDDIPGGHVEVMVLDANGAGVPGIAIEVTWDGGEEVFYTGLKPDVSPGYADFTMAPDRLYTLTLPGRAEPVSGITSAPCSTPSGRTVTPGYRLTFIPAGETSVP